MRHVSDESYVIRSVCLQTSEFQPLGELSSKWENFIVHLRKQTGQGGGCPSRHGFTGEDTARPGCKMQALFTNQKFTFSMVQIQMEMYLFDVLLVYLYDVLFLLVAKNTADLLLTSMTHLA